MTSGWISSVSETRYDFGFLDLLAEKLRRAPDHETRNEDGDDAVDERVQKSDAFAAEHALQHHADEGSHASERRVAVVHRIHAAGGEQRGDAGEQSALGNAEADFLALHVPAGLRGTGARLDAGVGQQGRAGLLATRRQRAGT